MSPLNWLRYNAEAPTGRQAHIARSSYVTTCPEGTFGTTNNIQYYFAENKLYYEIQKENYINNLSSYNSNFDLNLTLQY